jgi:MFS superfamily sulfate permease-like transporter
MRILLGLYLAFALLALAAALLARSDDGLSAVFLVIAALPWTPVASWLVDQLAQPPQWLAYALMLAGILLNALVLYGLSRLVRCRSH